MRRSCCVHHVSTGVEHNSCEVRPEEEERQKDSCYNTWTPHTAHGHYTQHMDTTHSTWTPSPEGYSSLLVYRIVWAEGVWAHP